MEVKLLANYFQEMHSANERRTFVFPLYNLSKKGNNQI
jgi:hypothetical protein